MIHDIKNFIYNISLLISNKDKFHNPQFQKDALFTLENTITKMHRLIDEFIEYNDYELLEKFLKDPTVNPNRKDEESTPPLYRAIELGKLEVINYLLWHPDLNPNETNTDRDLPLFLAIRKEYTGVIEGLLDHSNIDLSTTNAEGKDPLSYAKEKGNTDAIELIEKYLEKTSSNK